MWRDDDALRDEVAVEFAEFSTRRDALQLALERVAAVRAEKTRRYCAERWRRMLPQQRRSYNLKRRARRLRVRLCNRAPIVCANPRCAVVFVPVDAKTLYCTVVCRKRASVNRAHRAHRARTAQERIATCPVCSCTFERWRRDELYCSKRCYERARYLRKTACPTTKHTPAT